MAADRMGASQLLGSADLVKPRNSLVARRLYLHVNQVGSARFEGVARFDAYTKPGAGVFWIESGTGLLEIGERVVPLRPDSGPWLVRNECARVYRPVAGGTLVTRHIWFSGPGVDPWLRHIGGRREIVELDTVAGIRRIVTEAFGNSVQRGDGWEMRNHLLLTRVIFETSHLAQVGEPSELSDGVGVALNMISANSGRNWSPAELAVAARMSYSSFRAEFRRQVGMSPNEYIQGARLDYAKGLLRETDLAIEAISRQADYATAAYFCAAFKRQTGLSPTAYRALERRRTA